MGSADTRKPRSFRRLLRWILAVICLWLTGVGVVIVSFGSHDGATRSECIIVLGAAVQGKEPSPVFTERIRHGVDLYHQGMAPALLFTGGVGEGKLVSESAAGAELALKWGVPASGILKEEKSRTTQQNLGEAYAVMRAEGWKSAIIVSDPLHLKRAVKMAKDLGMNAVSSPTPTSRYQSLTARFVFLLREIYFFHHYILTGN